jgi:hypothetical protein
MDQVTLLILTVTLNALVTGVIVYFVQKRLERNFANRVFQDQLRIKRNDEKIAETLDALYKKIVELHDLTHPILTKIELDGVLYQVDPDTVAAIKTKRSELDSYFHSNRIYLIPNIYNDPYVIVSCVGVMCLIIVDLSKDKPKAEKEMRVFIEMINILIEFLARLIGGFDRLNDRNPNYRKLASQMTMGFISLTRRLAHLYKQNS